MAYREARIPESPTCTIEQAASTRFTRDEYRRVIGSDRASFVRAREGLRAWVAHTGSGVEVLPDNAEIATGTTVAIVTRQLGLWVLAACRIVTVTDQDSEFGFTYATLPDHPECGVESFSVREDGGRVTFDIEAISKPGVALVRLAAPVTRQLQRRATNAYLDSIERWTRSP